jgi:hypothetical protein
LRVEIFRCHPDETGTAESAAPRFTGYVVKPNHEGPMINCEAVHWLSDLQNEIPDMLVQSECNHEFCSAQCGVSLSVWTFTGIVADYAGDVLTLAGIARANGGALPEIGAGWFESGMVEFGDGAGYQARDILSSGALAGGRLTLTVSSPFDLQPAGTVRFYPTCLGPETRCKLFYNYQQFGGFPFVPTGNPALKPIKKETSQGKK